MGFKKKEKKALKALFNLPQKPQLKKSRGNAVLKRNGVNIGIYTAW